MTAASDHALTHTHNNLDRQTSMLPAGFETAVPALDRAATGIGTQNLPPASNTSAIQPETAELQTHKTKFM